MTASASTEVLKRRTLYRGRKGRAAVRRLHRWTRTAQRINYIIDRLKVSTMFDYGPFFLILPEKIDLAELGLPLRR